MPCVAKAAFAMKWMDSDATFGELIGRVCSRRRRFSRAVLQYLLAEETWIITVLC
jgi:hypothetical protein